MRIGFILECTRGGPDQQVYQVLIQRLVADGHIGHVEPEFVCLDNLPILMNQCGASASTLLQSGCEHVFVCWDLYPGWRTGKERPLRCDHRERIFATLDACQVDPGRITLLCITQELEAWLLADGAAIASLARRPPVPRIADVRYPETVHGPKDRLENHLRAELKIGAYAGHIHAVQIARAIRLRNLARAPSFCRLVTKLRALVGPAATRHQLC
jgi:hypothetical protein